jgi:antitoxin component YwqK of YwqJK toxin-antitoxin module
MKRFWIRLGLCALTLTPICGCQKVTPERIPFAEGKSLVCPENTRRVEVTNTSYPEYYCIGDHGRTGEWLEFDVNGRLRTRAEYHNDKLNGKWTLYHADGSVDTQGQTVDGKRTGEWKQWYVNGNLRSIKHYDNNRLHGNVELYYQTGTLMAKGDYVDEFEEGPWQVFTPEGKLARECRMQRGEEKDCVIHIEDFQITSKKYNSKERGPL